MKNVSSTSAIIGGLELGNRLASKSARRGGQSGHGRSGQRRTRNTDRWPVLCAGGQRPRLRRVGVLLWLPLGLMHRNR